MRKREKRARQRTYSQTCRERRNLSGEVRYEVWIPREHAELYREKIQQVIQYFKEQYDSKSVQQ